MRILLLIVVLIRLNNHGIQCQDIETIVESPMKDIQTAPSNIEIVGDTSHLFAPEDFQKKEAELLGDESDLKKNELNNGEVTFREDVSLNLSLRETVMNLTHMHNQSDNVSSVCTLILTNNTENSVKLVNGSVLTKHLTGSKDTECFLVLFYVPWCPFSIQLAPIYNALPRAFLNVDFLAFDVSKSVGYNTKFGTSAVPMIILFQHKNILAKFNYTNKVLTDYIEFVSNHTNFAANKSIEIEHQDFTGPLPTVVVEYFDYYLLASWICVIFVSCDLIMRKTAFKQTLISFIEYIITSSRARQLPQGPQRRMIQNNGDHLHND